MCAHTHTTKHACIRIHIHTHTRTRTRTRTHPHLRVLDFKELADGVGEKRGAEGSFDYVRVPARVALAVRAEPGGEDEDGA